ncbi:Hypothetical predicted protein [Olea europaea subsp. europaea]|uniref:Uncharacterized protein n=1 Tax=Olea europaea subsp. europaea TaxID=158383 RepID=A0A8S0QKJ8_OLEEU|nr:Hypothetical predicted protein [Olea europaea subsp. europaea]
MGRTLWNGCVVDSLGSGEYTVDIEGLTKGVLREGRGVGGQYSMIKEGINYSKVPGWGETVRHIVGKYSSSNFMLGCHLGNKVTKEKKLEAIERRVNGGCYNCQILVWTNLYTLYFLSV